MFSFKEYRIRFCRISTPLSDEQKGDEQLARRAAKRRCMGNRVLRFDSLESRRLLAGDMGSSEIIPAADLSPTDLTAALISGIPENQTNILLGTLDIVDADGGPSNIDFGAFNQTLQMTGNELWLIAPNGFNFEQASSFSFDVQVFGGASNSLAVTKSFVLDVLDRNDSPSGIDFQGSLSVQEFVKGFQFGTFEVVDEDAGETYTYLVDDPRFEVANGNLQLKPDASLRYTTDSALSIEIVATGTVSGDVLRSQLAVGVTLAPPPWQNKNWALDVNNDGDVTALDALLVINFINQMGIGAVDTPPPAGSETFVDVNGDRFVTPLDVLIIINFLNQVHGPTSEGEVSEPQIAGSPDPQVVPPPPSAPTPAAGDAPVFQLEPTDIQKLRKRLVVA